MANMMPFPMSPGLMDGGAAPKLKGSAKAAQRSTENRADQQMHSASPDRYATSGMERAMGKLADKMHSPKKPALDQG